MTFAEIAAELGVDERTVRRVLADLLERLRAGLDPDLDLEHFAEEISAYYEIPRRFRETSRDGLSSMSPRAAPPLLRRFLSGPVSGVDERAGLLPRRFRSKP